MGGKALWSGTICVPLWFRKSSNWKLLARSSAAVSRSRSTEVRKNNVCLVFLQKRELKLHFKGEYPRWLPCVVAVDFVTSTKTALRPATVLFVVPFSCSRNGSLEVHESQMLIASCRGKKKKRMFSFTSSFWLCGTMLSVNFLNLLVSLCKIPQ